MLPIHMLPAFKTLRVLGMSRRGLRSFDQEHAARLVERGYAQVREGCLFITQAGKLASKIVTAKSLLPSGQRTGREIGKETTQSVAAGWKCR